MVQVQQNKCLSLQAISRQNHHHHEHKFKLGARHFRSSRPTGLKLRLIELFAVVSLVPLVWHNNNVQLGAALIQVPNRHTVASIPGDLVLGILVPVHERPSPKQAQTRTCGAVREQYGIQRVEAAFRTIDSINADPNILPNITLGIEIRDSCWHSPIALEQSIEFIRDAMAASEQPPLPPPGQQPSAVGATRSLRLNNASSGTQSLATAPTLGQQNLEHNQHQLAGSASGSASTASTTATAAHVSSSVAATCALYLKQQQQTKKIKNLVGVVGPASSGDTVQVQNLLQLFNMPQVGYSATSRDLSNKNFFKYFLRVVPSDKLQAQVLIDLMLAHNWTYITVVYTEGSYGSSLMNAFRERAQEVGICFATLESMPPNADDGKFDELIEAIQNHRNARVVICMCEGRTIGRLFAGFKRQNISNEFLIVGSDGWSDRFDVVEQQEEIALGGISIRIHSAYVHDFDDYYFGLNPFTNHRNPWFAEFWEQRFQCNLEYPMQHQQQQQQQQQQHQHRPAFIRPANARVYNRTCTGKESLRQNHKQDAKMAFVQKSIITMALGLDSMQRAICAPNKPGLCAEMLPVNGSVFLQHLMDVRFSFLGEEVYFDEQGDPPGKYEILNFQRKQKLLTDDERLQNARDPPRGDSKFGKIDYGETGPNQDNLYDQSSYGEFRDDESGYTSTKLSLNKQQKQQPPQQQQQRKQQQQQVINSGASIGKHSSSYATLHVHNKNRTIELDRFNSSPSAARAGPVGESNLISRIDKRQAPPSSDYSSTSDYEYVHVGSWKSSDGLSLFGTIHWPIRSSTTFQRHHYQHNQRNQQQHSGVGASPPGQWPIGDGAGGSSTTQVSPNQQGSSGTNGSTALSEWSLDPTSGAGPGTGAGGGGGGNYEQRYESDDDVPVPKSVCSLPCAKGHAKKIQSDSVKCCWVCVPCRPREYLFTEFKCKACDKGWWPNADQTGCDQIPIEYLDWRSLEALVSIAIALFGLVLTLLTALVFIKHNDTPVVKSTTRELSYMILFSMVLCYINTFFLVTKPNKQACFVTRILPGFSFAMMYGALVTKTNRIARILAGSKKKIITRRPCFMSATAQVTITWLIVLIECAIIVIGLVKEPADMTLEYPSDERVALVCNTTTMAIIAPLGFDFFLIAMCTVYAFKTRNVPENFNEAKFIGFTMYTTLVIWIAFVVIYLSSDHKVTTLCLCISFSALFALFLLFFPRCYIILFKPEKNNRSYFTTIKNVRCHIGYQIPGGSGTGGSGHGGQSGSTTSAGIASANNSLIGQLNASTNNQIKFKGARGGVLNAAHLQRPSSSLTSSPTTKKSATASIIGNHFAYSAKGLLLSAPDETTSSRQQQHHHHHNQHKRPGQLQLSDSLRGRTSGGRVAPAATRLSPEDQKLWEAGKLTESDVRQRLRADSDEVTDCAQRTTSRSPNGSGPRGPIGNNDAGADAELDANENGTAADVARDGSDVQRGPLHFVFGAVRSIQSAFARRSSRKESDKTAVIQQHLRAIRHAENLDRQTHFRRSQVQRLVQRFDSNTLSSDQQVMLMNGQHLNGQLESDETTDASRLAMQQFCEFLGDQQNCDLVKFVHSGEAIHLLAGMSQLLGHDNVCRLASVLSRYCDQNRGQIVTPIGEGTRNSSLTDQVVDLVGAPLNLRRPADRRMALAWLRFLVQMSHKAIESVQTIISTLPKHLTSPLLPATSAGDELLLSARALELASKQETGCIVPDSSPQGEAGDKKEEPACQCGNSQQLAGGDGNAKETKGRRQVKSADYATHNLSRPRRVSDTVSTQQDNNGLVLDRVSCCQSKLSKAATDDKLSTTTRDEPNDRSMPARAVNMATSANMSRQPPSSGASDKWTGNELDNNEPMGRSGNLNRLDQKRIGANGASDVNESEMLQASAVKHKYDSAMRAPSDDNDDPIRLVLERISAPGQRQQAVGRNGSSHMGDDKRCCRREEGRAKTPPASHSKARRPQHDTLDDDRDQETCLHLNERGQLELLASSSPPTRLADSGKQNGGDWRAADCSQLEGHEGQAKNKEESQRCCRANGTRVVPHIGASGELVAINGQVRAASAGSGRSDQTSSSALERSTSGNCGPPPSEHHVDSSLCRSRCRTQVRHCPACATGRHLCKTGATCRSCSRLHRARANTTPTPPTCDLNNGLEVARTLVGQSPSACKLNRQVAPQQHQEQQLQQEAQVKANRTCCFRRCCRRCSCCSCTIQDSRCRSRSREANQQEQEQHNGKGKDKDKERLPQHAHHHHHHHRHIHSYQAGHRLELDEPASKMKHSTSCSSAMVRIASRPINLSAIEINVKRKEEEDNNLVVMTPKRLQEVAVTSATTASSLSASSRPLLSSKVDEHRPPGAANSIAGAYQQRPAGGHDV